MKKILSAALGLIGISTSAAPDQKTQSLDPKSILFSVPTISNDLAPVEEFDGDPRGADVAFHEDEWRQIEFFAQSQLSAVQRMMKEYKAFEAEHRTEHGWRNVYVRKIDQAPPVLSGPQALHELEVVLDAKAGPAPVLFSSGSVAGQVVDGFSIPLDGSVLLYGYANHSGIPILGALLGENPDHQALVRAITKLNAQKQLVLADWCQQLILASVARSGQLETWCP